jgi:uncharacterized membrane protein
MLTSIFLPSRNKTIFLTLNSLVENQSAEKATLTLESPMPAVSAAQGTTVVMDTAAKVKANKYDNQYEKHAEASFAGVFILMVPVIFTFFVFMEDAHQYALDSFLKVMIVGALVTRVLAAKWIANIADEQNRQSGTWAFFAILLPGISLLIIGQTKKLTTKREAGNSAYVFHGHRFLHIKRHNHKSALQYAS